MSLLFELSSRISEIDYFSTWTTIADCKGEGNTLKPYLPEKKTVVVSKTLVLKCVWVPSLVHPHIIKSCLPDVTHVIKFVPGSSHPGVSFQNSNPIGQ